MNYSCLIVDDEEAIAQSISEYFELFGVSSTYVTGFQACLDFFGENTASILLLDINSPVRFSQIVPDGIPRRLLHLLNR